MILPLLLALLAQTTPATPPAPPPPRGPGLRAADADGDGVVTRQEAVVQSDAMFARMDANHDGTVTAGERRAAMTAMRDERGPRRGGRPGPGGATDGDVTLAGSREMTGRLFERLDTNRDGKLDATELAVMRRGPGGPRADMPPPPPER